METLDNSPLNYTLEGFHYYTKENELVGARRSTIFEVVLLADGKAMRHEVSFDTLLKACEQHTPAVFAFIKQLEEDIDASHLDYPELVEALEGEGFDFEQLVRCYLDHIPARCFYPEDSPPPELQAAAAEAAEFLKTMDWEEFRKGMRVLQNAIEYLEMDKLFLRRAKKVLNSSLVRLNEFTKKRLKEFYYEVDLETGYMATKFHSLRKLAFGDEAAVAEWENEMKLHEPDNKRAAIIEDRRNKSEYPHEFSVELVAMENYWKLTGDNEMHFYVHVVAAEGDAYLDVAFRNIRDEAYLYAPALYERIRELEGSIEAVLPKEGEVVEALLAEGWDLTPLLHSYCKEYGNITYQILWKRLADEGGYEPHGEYYDYVKGRDDLNDNYVLWSQTCNILETKLVEMYMKLLAKEYPELLEAEDWRVTERVVVELKVICSNLMYEIKHQFPELHVGGPVWPEKEA